jgi:hypothetical protein
VYELVIALRKTADESVIEVPLQLLTVIPSRVNGGAEYAGREFKGRWHCGSPYLGNNLLGGYSIYFDGQCKPGGHYTPKRKIRVHPKISRTVGGEWVSCNPSAYFHDRYIEYLVRYTPPQPNEIPITQIEHLTPFLVLHDIVLTPGRAGQGRILRHYAPGVDSNVTWQVKPRS